MLCVVLFFILKLGTCLCSALFLNALPVPLLRQVFFSAFWASFSSSVLRSLLEGPERALLAPVAPFWAHFGAFLVTFGSPFGG